MKLALLISGFLSFSAFANTNSFSRLECKGYHKTLLKIELPKPVSAINDSGLDVRIEKAQLTVEYFNEAGKVETTVKIPNVTLSQATSHLDYQLSLSNQIVLKSSYPSFLTIHPQFKGPGKSLSGYKGEVEINGVVNGHDSILMKSHELKCYLRSF